MLHRTVHSLLQLSDDIKEHSIDLSEPDACKDRSDVTWDELETSGAYTLLH